MRQLWARQEMRVALVAAPLLIAAAIITAVVTDAHEAIYGPPAPTTTTTQLRGQP